MRNFKIMWEEISDQFKSCHGVVLPARNCESRWRVLVQAYKKYIDNKNKTGTGFKFFEYAEEMEKILGKKKNLSATQCPQSLKLQAVISGSPSFYQVDDTLSRPANKPRRQYTDNEILDKIRRDKAERHKEKMAFKKEKFKKLYQLELRKLESKDAINNLLKQMIELQRERNNILNQILQKQQ